MPFTLISSTCQIQGLNAIYDKYFDSRKPGVFVEVGGNDGYLWSNTWGLAEMGWRGLYYEPVDELAMKCRKLNVSNNVGVISTAVGSTNTKTMLYHGHGATTTKHVAELDLHQHGNSLTDYELVPCVTLNSSLEEQEIPHVFDLLVIDTNGGEPAVLAGIDFDLWEPTMLIIATHKGHFSWDFNAEEIDSMVSRWYTEIWRDHINSIYIRRGMV